MTDIWKTTAVAAGAIAPGTAPAAALALRAKVLGLTQAAEDAVLAPKDCGAWPADLRAVLAARMARLCGQPEMAETYLAKAGDSMMAPLADPARTGAAQGLEAVLAFADKVTMSPRSIAEADMDALKAAGVADADIVRLCELHAFMAYQLRLAAGMKLMAEAAA